MSDQQNTQDEDAQFLDNAKNYRGWDLASESFKLGDKKWVIVKECKTADNDKIIRGLSDKIIAAKNDLINDRISSEEALKISRENNKKILEMTLTGFKYDTEAKEFGHVTLASVSVEMQALFLMIGGWEELIYRLKQTREGKMQQLRQAEVVPSG